MRVVVLAAVVVAAAAAQGTGQSATTFEAASVKRDASGFSAPMRVVPAGDRLTITNVPLRQLIQMAYRAGTRDDVVGGPGWINDERYDVAAKADAPFTSSNEWQPKLAALLAQRFHLVIHTESRSGQTFTLVRMKDDGALGPQLRRASEDCMGNLRAGNVPQGVSDPCGLEQFGEASITGHIKLHGVPVDVLRTVVAVDFNAGPVVDETGLSGPFDIELVWTPQPYFTDTHVPDRRPDADRKAPELRTALQEQLGLSVKTEKSAKDVVVIDHVERPTED
jgi:uncharacterized protein (TIGR03435 family)